MKITIIGTGYVGLVTGACLADAGNEVCCVDKNREKIGRLLDGAVPIYEPGLEELVKRGVKEGRLFFTTSLDEAANSAAIYFLTVDTPPRPDGHPDLSNVFAAAEALGEHLQPPALVVTKSTVPVGTTLQIKARLQEKLKSRGLAAEAVAVASNPEFLKEGTSVQDFRYPDRIVVGVEREADADRLRELYAPFMRKRHCFLVMDIASAELSKYAANAMLASRISFMNEIGSMCERIGANVDKIREVLGWDPRIGPQFLYAGLGYGGSCFPKDVLALLQTGKSFDLSLPMVAGVDETNRRQRQRFWKKIENYFKGAEGLRGKTIALWGIAFKPETDDIREAPAVDFIENLLQAGARVRAFDPVAMDNARRLFPAAVLAQQLVFLSNNYDCLEGADALLIATEWNAFRSPDFERMRRLLRRPVLFDGRNLYDPSKMQAMGFDYFSVGR